LIATIETNAQSFALWRNCIGARNTLIFISIFLVLIRTRNEVY
jgi:hypothetical protein